MNENAVEQQYLPDEIAVDLPHRELVINCLNGIDVLPATERGDVNKILDLGLIKFLDAKRTADRIMKKWPADIPVKRSPVRATINSPDSEPLDIDIILDGLRLELGKQNDGWYPRMGKVRNADVVGGLPHIGGGREYPEPSDASEFLPPAGSAEGKGVRIGMIDSPMYPYHPELKDRWYAATGFSSVWAVSSAYPWLRGHSAFVAGRILRKAPGARLEVRGVLQGPVPRSTVWDVATAMADALEAGVEVLNLSLGCYTTDGQPPFVLARAVEVLSAHGVAVIAAAGNHGDGRGPYRANAPIFPAACPGAIAVGAFENADPYKPASLSPEGPWVALGAPGAEVLSTYFVGGVEFTQLDGLPTAPATGEFAGYATWSGTSFAAAAVSGEIARMMTNSGMSAQDAVAKLRETDPGRNDGIGRYR